MDVWEATHLMMAAEDLELQASSVRGGESGEEGNSKVLDWICPLSSAEMGGTMA